SAEGEIALSWSAPRNQNFVAMGSYEIRFATFSAAAAGGVEKWYASSVSSSVLVSPAKKPGALETLVIGGLKPSATFYFVVKGFDRIGEASLLDLRARTGDQAFAKPLNLPPSIPAGLKALEGINKAFVSWNDLSSLNKGLDFQEYRLYRSTAAGMGFERVLSTAALAHTDKPLAPWTTYYYKLSSADEENLESVFSSTVSVVPYTLPPQEPFGIRQSISSDTLTLSWNPTTRFGDSSLFESTSTPSADELLGYQILRSTDPCAPFSPAGVNGLSSTTFTDFTNGKSYLYQIHSFNSLGFSTGALTVTSLGDQFF
ncbi:MAG: fibronectin type III domain-containing protein, partial [Elusimicrobiota bacterium]